VAHLVWRDPYPFAFLLFLGNIVQLLLMFVIMVGQQVLAAASDKRAVMTYEHAEAILHECLQMQEHLGAQDTALEGIVKRHATARGQDEGPDGRVDDGIMVERGPLVVRRRQRPRRMGNFDE
jgi:uncharacterized membrane protein